jgi:hypothetical protein
MQIPFEEKRAEEKMKSRLETESEKNFYAVNVLC